jgi:hypothetical protein
VDVHRQPVAAALDLDQAVGHAGGQEDPVARAQVHPFTTDLQHGGAGEEGDPLVLVLEVVLRGDVGAAQDLFDDDVAEGDDLFDALAGGGDVSRRPQRAPDWGKGDGLVGVVLAHDGAPAAAAVVPRADPAQEQDDKKHEKEDRQHG